MNIVFSNRPYIFLHGLIINLTLTITITVFLTLTMNLTYVTTLRHPNKTANLYYVFWIHGTRASSGRIRKILLRINSRFSPGWVKTRLPYQFSFRNLNFNKYLAICVKFICDFGRQLFAFIVFCVITDLVYNDVTTEWLRHIVKVYCYSSFHTVMACCCHNIC